MLYKINGITMVNLILENIPRSIVEEVITDASTDIESIFLIKKQLENILEVTSRIVKSKNSPEAVKLRREIAVLRRNPDNKEEVEKLSKELDKFPFEVSENQPNLNNEIVKLNFVSIGILEYLSSPSVQLKINKLLALCIYKSKNEKNKKFFDRELYVLNEQSYNKLIFFIFNRIDKVNNSKVRKEGLLEELNRFIKVVFDNLESNKSSSTGVIVNSTPIDERVYNIFSKKSRLSSTLVPGVYQGALDWLEKNNVTINDDITTNNELLNPCVDAIYQLKEIGLFGYNVLNQEMMDLYKKIKKERYSAEVVIAEDSDIVRVAKLMQSILECRKLKEGELLVKQEEEVNLDDIQIDLSDDALISSSDSLMDYDELIEDEDLILTDIPVEEEEILVFNNDDIIEVDALNKQEHLIDKVLNSDDEEEISEDEIKDLFNVLGKIDEFDSENNENIDYLDIDMEEI